MKSSHVSSEISKRPGLIVLISALVSTLGIGILQAQPAFGATYDSFHTLTVTTRGTSYAIDLVTINLANPKLHVLTLTGTNQQSCYQQSCPVRSLKSYVKEAKGFAGINGSYFCPKEYTTCGLPGNFYWMVFNARNSVYVNRTQSRFNKGPLITFDASMFWHIYPDGRQFFFPGAQAHDNRSKITAAISNGPLLIHQGKYVVDSSTLDQKQRTVKSNRSGIAVLGTKIYLLVAQKATVPDLGRIMQKLGVEHAINLDGGGSSALWYRGSYKVGPGRDIPNAVVFSER